MNTERRYDSIFEGPGRIEAGYCTRTVVLPSGRVVYPVNADGCAMLARWCLKMADKPYYNKYERWQWHMDAAKWYRLAAGKEV